MIAQEHQAALLLGVVDFHPSEELLPAFARQSIKRNNLVSQHLAPSRHRPSLHHQVAGVVLQPRHPKHALPSQVHEPLVLDVAMVEHHNRS